jgi:hypothetical protein
MEDLSNDCPSSGGLRATVNNLPQSFRRRRYNDDYNDLAAEFIDEDFEEDEMPELDMPDMYY